MFRPLILRSGTYSSEFTVDGVADTQAAGTASGSGGAPPSPAAGPSC